MPTLKLGSRVSVRGQAAEVVSIGGKLIGVIGADGTRRLVPRDAVKKRRTARPQFGDATDDERRLMTCLGLSLKQVRKAKGD